MNARYAPGATLPRPDPASVGETVATRRPLITDLVVLPEGGYAYGVGVPVIRGGAVKYVLTAAVSAEAHRELLLSQARAPDRIAVLYDRQSRIVYRTVNPEKLIGTTVTPKLAEASAPPAVGRIGRCESRRHTRARRLSAFQLVRLGRGGRHSRRARCTRRSSGRCGRSPASARYSSRRAWWSR
jgi:hypothetical protein